MTDHADLPAPFFLLQHDLPDPGIRLRHMMFHIFLPVVFLFQHLLPGHPADLREQLHHAGIEIVPEILLQRQMHVRKVFLHILHKARIVHRCRGVHRCIVMIQHQTRIFQHIPSKPDHNYSFFIIHLIHSCLLFVSSSSFSVSPKYSSTSACVSFIAFFSISGIFFGRTRA